MVQPLPVAVQYENLPGSPSYAAHDYPALWPEKNISESCRIASNRSVESWEKCAAGVKLSRMLESSRAACMTVSDEESAGIVTIDGEKATVSQIRPAVSGMYIFQKR